MSLDAEVLRERLRMLRQWRRVACLVARAARELVPGARIYVVGGAAEGRLTALSDLDVLVVLPREPRPEDKPRLSVEIYERAVDLGMPLEYPLDLHLAGPESFKRYAERVARILDTEELCSEEGAGV